MKTKSNNSGFSLVELIVVIAIMAVLVGVLAPTLIGNIEKSRESKDLQNLDTIRQAAVTAIANEAAYKEVVPAASGSTTTLVVSWDSTNKKVTVSGATCNNFSEEFASIVTSDPTMSSNAAGASGNVIQLVIEASGAVTAQVSGTSGIVSTVKTKDSNGSYMSFESK